jgi:hypothetical protein
MKYVAILNHSPAQCPGSNKEVFALVSKTMPTMEAVGKGLGVKVDALHVLLPAHSGVFILDAPDYNAAAQFLMQLRVDSWNDVSLHQSTTPEEAMKISAERFAAG